MNIEELKQLGLGYEDKITIVAYNMIPLLTDTHKATFITINQPDKRRKKYNIVVKLYRCQNITFVDVDNIISIRKGWE